MSLIDFNWVALVEIGIITLKIMAKLLLNNLHSVAWFIS